MEHIELATLDYLQDQKILFCVIGPTVSSGTLTSFMDWAEQAHLMTIEHKVETIDNINGDAARNTMIELFLKASNYTHIMFVNPRIVFRPHDVLALVSAKKHIISAKLTTDLSHKTGMSSEGLIKEVESTPIEFTMISREVFSHLKGAPYFSNDSFLKDWRELSGKVWVHTGIDMA